jgi:hypothetical protein
MVHIVSETQFENHLRFDILPFAIPQDNNHKLFDFKKAVDILIARNGVNPKLFFIEVKYHKPNHGRLGFGHSKGGGFQPEVLITTTDYFEDNMRWILGEENSEKYWFVDNNMIGQYLNGDVVGQKYNGIKIKFFKEVQSVTKEELIIKINNWLLL